MMINKKGNKMSDIINQYEVIRPTYIQLTTRVTRLIEELLHAHSIKFHTIESRTKEIDSLKDKLVRKSEKYLDPLNEITDFTGIRVITYFLDDVLKISDLINNEFKVDNENSSDQGNLLNYNEFGYRSVHFVVTLSDSRSVLTEWATISNIKFEIQVRTVLQHAWAGISHTLQYKHETEIPTSLRRQLFRLSGLFELADEEFVDIKEQHLKYIDNAYDEDEKSIEINLHTILKFLTESDLIENLRNVAEKIGFLFEDPYQEPKEDETDQFDSMIISYCNIVGIKTIDQLESFLEDKYEFSIDYLETQYNNSNSYDWIVTESFLVCLLLIGVYPDKFTVKTLIKLGWHRLNAQRILEVANNFVEVTQKEGDIA